MSMCVLVTSGLPDRPYDVELAEAQKLAFGDGLNKDRRVKCVTRRRHGWLRREFWLVPAHSAGEPAPGTGKSHAARKRRQSRG